MDIFTSMNRHHGMTFLGRMPKNDVTAFLAVLYEPSFFKSTNNFASAQGWQKMKRRHTSTTHQDGTQEDTLFFLRERCMTGCETFQVDFNGFRDAFLGLGKRLTLGVASGKLRHGRNKPVLFFAIDHLEFIDD